MKKLFAAAALAATTVVPLLPATGVPLAHAVSCTVFAKNLAPGTTGPDVLCLEQRLVELGFGGINPDTYYDTTSVNAVKFFQTSRGLYPDGLVTSVNARQLGLRGGLPDRSTRGRVTVIGDSTSAAMRWYDESNNSTLRYDVMGGDRDLLWSVESCRRLVVTSCTGRTDPGTGAKWVPVSVLPLMKSTLSGRLGEALVIMAGYDDTTIANAIDPIMAEAKAQGVSRVFWLNYRLTNAYNGAYQGYYASHNANLEAAKVRHPNLVVLDWNGYSYAQPAATQQAWFTSDQIHLTGTGGRALAEYIKANIDRYEIQLCATGNANAGVPAPSVLVGSGPTDVDTGFTGLAPVRVLDTRNAALGGGSGRIGAGRTVMIDIAGELPAGATAAVLNVTAANPCRTGYLTVYACGVRPGTSNVNFAAARTTAGTAITAHTGGAVCIYSSAVTDLIVDVVGAFAPGGDLFHPTGPTRWVDTRGNPAQVAIGGPLGSGTQIDVPVAGRAGVAADATAAWVNLTATPSATSSVLQVYPGPCATPPTTSAVNVLAGRAAANATLVPLGNNGGICVRAFSGTPHVVIDLAGWFGGPTDGGLSYRSSGPQRLLDTRGSAMPAAGSSIPLTVSTTSVLNVTSAGSTGFGFVSARPCGSSNTTSLLNTALNETVANVGAVGPGAGGQVCISPSVAGHIVVDVSGVFVTPSPG